MTTLDALLRRSSDPSAPLLTYYDLGTGERVELSTVTTTNWVAKTSNFLVDDLDAEPGTRVRIGLPTHWLRAVWILSAWTVGAVVVDHHADIGLSGPDLVADEEYRVAASLRPFGARFATPPTGFLDLGAEVPGHGDHFIALDPPTPTTLALDVDGVARTHGELVAAATPDATRVLLREGNVGRDAEALVDACLGGGSLVLVTGGDEAGVTRVATQEHARIG